MAETKNPIETLLIPREQLKSARPWSPGPFTRRTAATPNQASPEQVLQAQARAIEALRLRAREEGFAAGLADGRALAAHEAGRIAQLANAMESALAGLEQNVATHLLALAIDLAKAVIRHELAARPEALLELVQEALRAVPESVTSGEILVNPADADLVKDYLPSAGYSGNWRVVGDNGIEPGGCRIATRACDIDATLETRWRRAMQSIGRSDAWHREPADA